MRILKMKQFYENTISSKIFQKAPTKTPLQRLHIQFLVKVQALIYKNIVIKNVIFVENQGNFKKNLTIKF